jgi:hypothetical protein
MRSWYPKIVSTFQMLNKLKSNSVNHLLSPCSSLSSETHNRSTNQDILHMSFEVLTVININIIFLRVDTQ